MPLDGERDGLRRGAGIGSTPTALLGVLGLGAAGFVPGAAEITPIADAGCAGRRTPLAGPISLLWLASIGTTGELG